MSGKIAITLKRSTIGSTDNMKATVRGLGLRKLHQTVIQPDNPSTRGAAFKIRHLVDVSEYVEGQELSRTATATVSVVSLPAGRVDASPTVTTVAPSVVKEEPAAPVAEMASDVSEEEDAHDDAERS